MNHSFVPCAGVLSSECSTLLLGHTQAVLAISKQNIGATKRWSSLPFVLELFDLDCTTWLCRVADDDLQWWSSVSFGPSSGKINCLSVVGLWVGWQGERPLPWDFQASFGTLVVQETDLPSQLLSLPIHATVCCSPRQRPVENPSSDASPPCSDSQECKLTRLLFSLCAAVSSLVWLMRSIQTRLPWPLTPPTSGFPVYTMTTACMCGMSETRRKWARCTLLCTTLPACGTLRYVVCRQKCWIASGSWGSNLKSCRIWMQTPTAERKNLLKFPAMVSVVATGLELELGTVLWLHCSA